jgi:hypothetical protein
MVDPEAFVEIWKVDIEERSERRATRNARFRHLKSKEREMLDAALAMVHGALQRAFSSVQGKLTIGSINKRLSY